MGKEIGIDGIIMYCEGFLLFEGDFEGFCIWNIVCEFWKLGSFWFIWKGRVEKCKVMDWEGFVVSGLVVSDESGRF